MKYEAPEALLILLQKDDVLATSSNPEIGKGQNTDEGINNQFGNLEIPLW